MNFFYKCFIFTVSFYHHSNNIAQGIHRGPNCYMKIQNLSTDLLSTPVSIACLLFLSYKETQKKLTEYITVLSRHSANIFFLLGYFLFQAF